MRSSLYDDHNSHLDADPQVAVRRATYDEDLGQASWIMVAEALEHFTPVGSNERLLADSGFELLEVRDLTAAVASVSRRWRGARDTHRAPLVALEGEEAFEGVQRFLAIVHTLASERRLSRFVYLASRPAVAGSRT